VNTSLADPFVADGLAACGSGFFFVRGMAISPSYKTAFIR
jgi:hypothetical protein